jgi:1-acyl-sn-glycerol-3-phosphate acyltransferase
MALLAVLGFLWFTFTQSSILFASDDIKKGRKPLSRRRRLIQKPGRWAARGLLFGCGYHRIKVKGSPSKDVKILVCNHQSFLEHFWHFYRQGCCFLAKVSFFRI